MQDKLLTGRDMDVGVAACAMHGRRGRRPCTSEGGGEGSGEGGPVGLCGTTGGTAIEGTLSRNS
jgi:hypothetical protein